MTTLKKINVKDFGARPDGSDCTNAFDAAIQYAFSNDIEVIEIPSGSYQFGEN